MDPVVERIRTLAKERGVKQSFLEERMGAYRGKITEWAKGKSTPTDEELSVVARCLGVSPSFLKGEALETEIDPTGDESLMYALFGGENLSEREMDEAYNEVKRFAKFVAEQKRIERGNG